MAAGTSTSRAAANRCRQFRFLRTAAPVSSGVYCGSCSALQCSAVLRWALSGDAHRDCVHACGFQSSPVDHFFLTGLPQSTRDGRNMSVPAGYAGVVRVRCGVVAPRQLPSAISISSRYPRHSRES